MPFRPVNDDHAIQSAAFAFGLAKPVQRSTIDHLRLSSGSWRTELPAVETPQLIDVQLNPATGAPRALVNHAVEFSYKRPDGSFVWALRVLGSEIAIETTRYTRWDPTWAKAKSILEGVVSRVAELEKDRGQSVRTASLIFVDVFLASEESPNFSELFESCDELPSGILSRGPLWHCHTGWFVQDELGRVLHNFNVDTKQGSRPNSAGEQERVIEVQITHSQALQFSPPTELKVDQLSTFNDNVHAVMSRMHDANKAMIKSLVKPAVRQKIGIDA